MPEVAAFLAIVSGAPARSIRLVPGEYVAGRVPGAQLLLPNMEVSRRHCRFTWTGEACSVEDMGSVRGTRVNGAKITARRNLQPGDKVEVGPVIVEFGLGEPPGAEDESAGGEARVAPISVRGKLTDRIVVVGELTIGREDSADVVLNDPSVSRRHAKLRAVPGGGCVVADLNSTAGSFVNGHRFDTHELLVGDRLQIGPFYFQYDGQALVQLSGARGSSVEVSLITERVRNREGGGTLTLLDQVSFSVPASQFAGILGPSGSGKSTLLNVLCGFRAPDEGTVLIDHADIYAGGTPPSFGYVPQDDIVHPELTVAQALRFSAKLRLPARTPAIEIERLITQTMEQLDIRRRADLPIHNLSGGQRKRVSVGVELLARPAILYLDEPSSGLDPATEFQLMELLRDLADSGCTIVCTTHVMENAYLMDQLLVLVAGCLAFQGSAQETRDYFGVSKLVALYERLREQTAIQWKAALQTERSAAQVPPPAVKPPPKLPPGRGQKPALRFPLPILLRRQLAIFLADWRNSALVFGEPLIVAALVSWVANTENDLAMFFAYLAILWFGCSNAAQEIVKEIPIYQRERLVGVGPHSYLLSKYLFQFAITMGQAALLYLGLWIGLKHLEGSVAWQILSLAGIAASSVGIGSLISALSGSVMQAVLVVPLVLIPQILFSGFTVKAHLMSPLVRTVARAMPTFASQRLVDTSFLWGEQVGKRSEDYGASMRSLLLDVKFKPSDIYTQSGPALMALATHAGWVVVTYLGAFAALQSRSRRR